MLRNLLLYFSRHQGLRRWIETSPRLTSRFIAGLTLSDALAVCERLNRGGIMASLDHLGENVASAEEAIASRDAYLEALGRVAQRKLDSTVSIKLSQFGLDVSGDLCLRNVDRVASEAARAGTSVEIDMESVAYVDRTLRVVLEIHEKYRNVRGVLQAYLHRTEKDVAMLCERRVPVRLCKGAYSEPPEIAFSRKRDVDANYVRLMKVLLKEGVYPGLATHDERIINQAIRFARENGIAAGQFEFQMLYGIRRDLERRLVDENLRLRLYVPYGDAWYPYFMRRLAERPANLLFLVRNFIRG